MPFDLQQSRTLLARTPEVLNTWLSGLPDEWTRANEGPDTWSAFDIVGHLVHGERTDWIPRVRILLEHGESRAFDPFDRFAQFDESAGKTLENLLDEFAEARAKTLALLAEIDITPADFSRRGVHPSLGTVTLENLLATWVAHDLGHIAQIARVMAKHYAREVGPWIQYLPVLTDRPQPAS